MTQEEHEDYKARLLQENKEYQQYEVGDIVTAEVDGKKLPICTLNYLSVRRAFGKMRKKGEPQSK